MDPIETDHNSFLNQQVIDQIQSIDEINSTFKTILDTIPTRIFWKDTQLNYLGGNQTFCDDAGINNSDELLGKTDYELAWQEEEADFYRACDQRVLNSGKAEFGIIETQQRADGSHTWLETNKATLKDKHGKVFAILGTYQDVTERFNLEREAANAAEANQAKSNFLANMSHEIRTPLNGVLGLNEILLKTQLSAEQRGYAELIQNSANSLLTIINDILDLSKIEAGMLEINSSHFNLSNMLKSVIAETNIKLIESAVKLNVDTSQLQHYCFSGDEWRIRQILNNLLTNAIKFTQSGFIELRVSEINQIDSSLLRFDVIDTGIGIPASQQHKLFERFQQIDEESNRSFGGTGLGLAICKQLCELMGGNIHYEKDSAMPGAHFYFELSLTRSAGNKSPSNHRFSNNENALDVLLVEDNVTNQIVTKQMLKMLGHHCQVCDNGREAIKHLTLSNYDLVLMDCQMPIMDGFQTTYSIRNSVHLDNPDIPIIALTANAMSGDQQRCLNAGMNDYLAKPINLDKLSKILERNSLQVSSA